MPIEQHAPGLERIVDLHAETEELASGLGGEREPAEGPVWWQEGAYLLFSDIGNHLACPGPFRTKIPGVPVPRGRV